MLKFSNVIGLVYSLETVRITTLVNRKILVFSSVWKAMWARTVCMPCLWYDSYYEFQKIQFCIRSSSKLVLPLLRSKVQRDGSYNGAKSFSCLVFRNLLRNLRASWTTNLWYCSSCDVEISQTVKPRSQYLLCHKWPVLFFLLNDQKSFLFQFHLVTVGIWWDIRIRRWTVDEMRDGKVVSGKSIELSWFGLNIAQCKQMW